jgi:hypothetical protein
MSIFDSFGGSFFAWFQDDVLPYLLGTLFIIIILLGVILNSVLITTLRKRNLLDIRPNMFVFQLAILDLISCILFLLPATVVAFMKRWVLTDYVCKVHGVLFTLCYLVMFWLLTILSIERVMRAKNFDLHDKLFLKSKAVTLFSVLIWFLAASVASIPISGWVPVSYNFYQAACVPVFSGNISYLCIVFVLGFCVCFVVYLITYIIIFIARKKKLEKQNMMMKILIKTKRHSCQNQRVQIIKRQLVAIRMWQRRKTQTGDLFRK